MPGPILVLLVTCILALTALREAANYWVDHSLHSLYQTDDLSRTSQQREIACKLARDFPASEPTEISEAMRAFCRAPVFRFVRQLRLYVSIGEAAKFSAAAVVTVILYLWTSARVASRFATSPGRTAAAMMRRETVYACLAAATILFAPALVFHSHDIVRRPFFGPFVTGPFHLAPDALVALRDSLSAVWFLITAPFVLPAVPLALISSHDSTVARATRLGWDRYLQFSALAAATTGPFIGVATLANWPIRVPVIDFLARSFQLGYFSRIVFDTLLTALALVAVITIAAAFIAAVGPRMRDAR